MLCQFLEEVDYNTAFKSLTETGCHDCMDTYYDCIWDVNILEYLIYLQNKRGNRDRAKQAIDRIGLLELNANNNEEIKREAANKRKVRFMQALVRQYVLWVTRLTSKQAQVDEVVDVTMMERKDCAGSKLWQDPQLVSMGCTDEANYTIIRFRSIFTLVNISEIFVSSYTLLWGNFTVQLENKPLRTFKSSLYNLH